MKLDDLIYDGIENTLDERLAQYTADLKKHHFSASYKIRRHQTIRSVSQGQKAPRKFSVRRMRYVLLAVILAAFLLTGFSVWYSVGRFTFNVHSDHSVTYLPDSAKSIKCQWSINSVTMPLLTYKTDKKFSPIG